MKAVLYVLVIFVTAIRTSEPCIIENIEISVDTGGEDVVVSWTYDTTCTNIRYAIEHSIDGVQVLSGQVTNEATLQKRICSKNEVTLTVRNAQGVNNIATKSFVVGQNNPVENLKYAGGRFEWSPPIGTETCNITYDVVWENQAGIDRKNTQETHFESFNLLPCNNKITVAPVVLGTRGPSAQSVEIVTPNDLGPVQDLVFNDGRIEWNPPTKTISCTVTYNVTLRNDMGTVTQHIEENYFSFVARPCLNEIVVTPIVLDVAGLAERTEHVAIPEDLGPVQDLVFNNGRFEWNPPNNTISCTVNYNVTLRNDMGTVTQRIEENYFAFDVRPCLNEIVVTPIVLDVAGLAQRTEHMAIPEDLGPVRDLTFNNGRFEWNPPIDTALCEVTYDVVWENYAGINEDNIHETYFEDIRECRNIIRVTPVVLTTRGPFEESERMVVPEVLGPVQDLVFNNGRFEWNRPNNAKSCNISYGIWFENEVVGEQHSDTDENHFTFDLHPCTWNRIEVNPYVMEMAGPTARSGHAVPLQLLGPVRDLVYNNGRFEWNPPNNTGICAITYDVIVQNNLGKVSKDGIELNYIKFDLDPCHTNGIEVTPVFEELRGQRETMTHSVVRMVSNLVLSQNNRILSANWNAPAGSEECDLVYKLTVSNNVNTNIVTKTSNETSFIFSGALVPCSTVEVIVSAIGAEVGTNVTASLTAAASQQSAPVLSKMMTSCYTTEMVWIGQAFEENMCEVTHFQMWCTSIAHNFTVRQNILDRFDRTFDIFLNDLRPKTFYTCLGYIFVTMVGFSPASQSIEFETNMESVGDLKLREIDGELVASWTPPFNYEQCRVVYEISFQNEITSMAGVTEELQHTFDYGLEPCTTSVVTVTPVSYTTSHGAPVNQSFSPEIVVNGIRDLQMGNNIVQWLAPLNTGICPVTYNVRHVGPQGEVRFYEIEETLIDVTMAPCSLHEVEVIPVVKNLIGPTSTLRDVTNSSDHSAPVHLLTIPDLTGAVILVKGETFELNECTIKNAIVECWYESGNVTQLNFAVVDDKKERLFFLSVDNLTPATVYTCRVRWDSSDFGKDFSFRTARTDLVGTIGNTNFTVSWDQEFGGGDLILGYVLVIESAGPIHYVPERCNIERSTRYVVEFPAHVTSYTFTRGFPNFRYNVTLFTRFSFGELETANKIIDTLPSIPGSPDLSIQWIYEPGGGYSVNGSVTWWMPCDTHGDLQSFIVHVASIFAFNDQEHTLEELSVIDADVPISDTEYSLVLKKVNPMFTYIVSVTTVAAVEGRETRIVITPPQACTCESPSVETTPTGFSFWN